jgi:transcription elongation factor Elf1
MVRLRVRRVVRDKVNRLNLMPECSNCGNEHATWLVVGLHRQEGIVDAILCETCKDHYVKFYEPWMRKQETIKGDPPGSFGGTEIRRI